MMKMCLVCSHGGHLTEMLLLKDAFNGHECFLVTYDEKHTRFLNESPPSMCNKVYLMRNFHSKSNTNAITFPIRILMSIILTTLKGLWVLIIEKPDVIISTGAEIAIPICFIAKVLGKRVIFVETFGRPYNPSFTAKVIYHIADLFLVQWEYPWRKYIKARYAGGLI